VLLTRRNPQKSKFQHSDKMRKNEFPENDEIVLGFSCYTREKAPRRLSVFLKQVRWEGKEIFVFHFCPLFLILPNFKELL